MKQYTAYIQKYGKKCKRVQGEALSSKEFIDYIRETYPNYEISMFWYNWGD